MLHDVAVVIGRFQPFHDGHLFMVQEALKVAKQLVICVGSSHRARTVKNPFLFEERKQLILDNLPEVAERLYIVAIEDQMYNEQVWIDHICAAVTEVTGQDASVALVAHDKDSSTYYLKHFPQWQRIELPYYQHLDATPIRHAYFAEQPLGEGLSSVTQQFLKAFTADAEYPRLQREYRCLKKYWDEWSGTPYPPFFVTTDSVVVCQDHLLVIQRKYPPGQDLWALPGGFVEAGEWIQAGLLRELREETQIALSDDQLTTALKRIKVFDHPTRSQAGRIVTHAGYFDLGDQAFPQITADDDAKTVQWYPLADIEQLKTRMHDDHFYIVKLLLEN